MSILANDASTLDSPLILALDLTRLVVIRIQAYIQTVLRRVDVDKPVDSVPLCLRCGVNQKPTKSHANKRKTVIGSNTSYAYSMIN